MALTIRVFSPSEVKNVIAKYHKASGLDLVTGEIVRKLPKKRIITLTTIYNRMLRLAYFSLTRKFPKPGKPPNLVKYRPINLLHKNLFQNSCSRGFKKVCQRR